MSAKVMLQVTSPSENVISAKKQKRIGIKVKNRISFDFRK